MANEIMLTPDELRAQARQIRVYKENQKSVMSRITNLVQTLSAVWKGPAQTAFVQKYMSMQPTYNSFQQAIEEFAMLLEEHADRMEKVDRDMASRISKI